MAHGNIVIGMNGITTNIFSEYTTHNEYKLGVNIDFLTIVFIGLIIWSDEYKIENENKYNK